MTASFAAQSRPVLEVRAVNLWRGEQHLLRNVSFELTAGELLQVMGPNGVGKSSLLRVIVGLLPAESGEIRWRQGEAGAENPSAGLTYLGHANALKADLTAIENLLFAVRLHYEVDRPACLRALDRLGVLHCTELPVRVLSAGQRRRVAMARVSLMPSRLWVLDEPVTNLDTTGVGVVEDMLAEHLSKGGAIVAAAHQTLLNGHAQARSLVLH